MSDFPHGVVHEADADLQAALRSDPEVFALWQGLTPLGRNEFICWVEDAKQSKTRQRRIRHLGHCSSPTSTTFSTIQTPLSSDPH